MADRSIAAGDTLRKLFIEFNATAEDIGDISDITGASGIIADATDVVEAVTSLNTDLTTISTDNHVFSGGSIIFEGATDDSFETTLAVADPDADRTITLPNATDTLVGKATTDTLTNKSIDLGNNTLTGSLAEFNSALQSESFVSLTGSETLTNKQLTSPVIAEIVGTGGIELDAVQDITLDAGGGDVVLKDDGTQYGSLTNTSGNLIVKSGSTTALTFTGANVTAAGNVTVAGDLTVQGTTTTVDSSSINVQNALVFEGATDDSFETTLTTVDPTADRTISLPNATDTLVGKATTDTLTNKTLTTPVIAEIDSGAAITLDATTDIILDADGADVILKDAGTEFGRFTNSSTDFVVKSAVSDKDMIFKGNDGGSEITALTFDMSEAGAATFSGNVTVSGNHTVTGNLVVNGSTTTVNSTNTTIDDNLLELNSGATSNANDTGIIMERGSTGDNAIIAWDESADKFVVGTTTATASDTGDLSITTGTLVANIEGNVTGAVTGNADTATALATGRTIGMTGDVVWTSASFDGSGNVTGTAALQANTVTSTELTSAVRLQILDSSGSVVKDLYGSGS